MHFRQHNNYSVSPIVATVNFRSDNIIHKLFINELLVNTRGDVTTGNQTYLAGVGKSSFTPIAIQIDYKRVEGCIYTQR